MKELPREEREYLEEEIKSFNSQPDWDKVVDLCNNNEKVEENSNNILTLYLLDIAPYPSKLRHKWELADMCDVDTDFSPDGRDKIKEWLKEKFGEQNCVSVGTYGTMGAKSSIQDVARVFNIRPSEYLPVSKAIDNSDTDLDLNELKEKYPVVRKFLGNHPEIIDTAFKLIGMKRNIGCIAAGMLVDNKIPIEKLIDEKDTLKLSFLSSSLIIEKSSKWSLINSGKRKCIRLDFDDGTFLECTHTHKILTENRGYVEANNLTENDEIPSLELK